MFLYSVHLLLIFCLSFFVPQVNPCSCKFQKPLVSYCNAHWVTHLKVVNIHQKQRLPNGLGFPKNVRYDVQYLNVFKTPLEVKNSTLPNIIFTPENETACGITLEKEREYLLTGHYINGTLVTGICGQILYNDIEKSKLNYVHEWSKVPISLNIEAINRTVCDNHLLFL